MNVAVGINAAALVYAAVTANVPMLLITTAIAAHQAALISPQSPVTEAYFVTHVMALEVTSDVAREMEGGAAELSPRRYGKDGHLDVTYVASDGATYRAILRKDAFLDADPVEMTRRAGVMDTVLASFVERDGKPLFDMLPHLHMCAGPCGDFHASSMFEDEETDEESDTEGSSWVSSENDHETDLRCWMMLPLAELGNVRDDDRLVLVVKDRASPISLALDSEFRLDGA